MSVAWKESVTEKTFMSWLFWKLSPYDITDDAKVENVICHF